MQIVKKPKCKPSTDRISHDIFCTKKKDKSELNFFI